MNTKIAGWISLGIGTILILAGLTGYVVCLANPTVGKVLFLIIAVPVTVAVLSAFAETRQVIQPLVQTITSHLTLPGYIVIAAILLSLLALCEIRDLHIVRDWQWQRDPGAVLASGQQTAFEATGVVKKGLTTIGDYACLIWTGEKPQRQEVDQPVLTSSRALTHSAVERPLVPSEPKQPFWIFAAALAWIAFGVVVKYLPAASASSGKPAEAKPANSK